MDQFFLPVLVPGVRVISRTSIRLIVNEKIYWNHVGREPISYPTSPYSRGTAPTPIEWVGPCAGLDDMENRNHLILPRIEFQVVQPTAYHCYDHIILTLVNYPFWMRNYDFTHRLPQNANSHYFAYALGSHIKRTHKKKTQILPASRGYHCWQHDYRHHIFFPNDLLIHLMDFELYAFFTRAFHYSSRPDLTPHMTARCNDISCGSENVMYFLPVWFV
jgi:hypothetical protein